MSTPAEILNMQAAEEARERILASSDGPTIITTPTPTPPGPTAKDRQLAYESAERWIRRTGRLVVGDGEETVRLELRCRPGGQLLADAHVDALVALARRLGAGRKDSDYLQRRARAFEYAETAGRGLGADDLREIFEQRFGLDEQDVRSPVRRARGEL